LPEGRYQLFETRQFLSDLQRLDPSVRSQIEKKLRGYVYPQLRQEPHVGSNIRKLKEWSPETWRYRIGDWRFFYEIRDNEKRVTMTTLSHRREAYR